MTPYAFEHAAAGWILAVVAVVMLLIGQGATITIALINARARIKQVETNAAVGARQAQHGERIASLEQQSALTLLNTPAPVSGTVLPQSWGQGIILCKEKGNG